MEAPETIFVNNTCHGCLNEPCTEQMLASQIEYVRKDAFIEKAYDFIRKGGNRGDAYIVTEFGEEVFNFVQFAEDFKNYIKGGKLNDVY